jgi:putative glutathione S-transferase
MGLLIDGQWHDQWYNTEASAGRFIRPESQFRNWITPDGAPGPSGEGGFPAEPDRYHLYIAYACPWAHRTLIYRALKGLQELIGVSIVHWYMGEHGWTFDADPDGLVEDRLYGHRTLYALYQKAKPDYTGRVTVPVLWDRQRETIVSNESREIIRMFNSAFDGIGATPGDYYPEPLRESIDAWNAELYENVNNGVYQAGFATRQEAYDEAVMALFETLDRLEGHLAGHRFLVGAQPTEADWRLFPTLLRFDPVYVGHFKTNRHRLVDYPNLWGYTLDLYQWPGIASTIQLDHAKKHYYQSHKTINPTGIVPVGPELDFTQPHHRDRLG